MHSLKLYTKLLLQLSQNAYWNLCGTNQCTVLTSWNYLYLKNFPWRWTSDKCRLLLVLTYMKYDFNLILVFIFFLKVGHGHLPIYNRT